MHFSKVSTALIALAVSVPDVVAMPSSNLDVRQSKAYPIMKPAPKGPPTQDTQTKNPDKGGQPITIPKPETNTPVTQQPQYKGYASHIYQSDNSGKCGQVSRDGDFVVALDRRRFDTSLCGKKIRVETAAQRSIEVTVVDSADGGIDENYLDLSVGAFKAISRIENGIEPVTWYYI